MSEVVPVHARKLIFGYKAIAYSSVAICVVGLFVWVATLGGGKIRFTSAMLFAIGLLSFPDPQLRTTNYELRTTNYA